MNHALRHCPRLRIQRFTLIELLVVIAIISVLASMLLPALTQARTQVRRTANIANHRQVLLATTSYADDADGYVPYSNPPALSGEGNYHPAPYAWDDTMLIQPLARYGLLPILLRSPTVDEEPIGGTGAPGKKFVLAGHSHNGDYFSTILYWPGKNVFDATWILNGQWFDTKAPVPSTRAFTDGTAIMLTDFAQTGIASGWSYLTHARGKHSWNYAEAGQPTQAVGAILGGHRTYADGHVDWVWPSAMGRNGGPVGTDLSKSHYSHGNTGYDRGYWF